MMRALSIVVLVCVLSPARAHAAATGDIDTVLVFADRARVTRARTVACEKGTARAVFERLPAALDVRTLRGEVREAAEVIGLSGEQVNEREAADPRARALAADLDKIGNDIKSNQARRTAIVAELEQLGAYGNVFSATLTEEIRNPKPNTPAWEAMWRNCRKAVFRKYGYRIPERPGKVFLNADRASVLTDACIGNGGRVN